MKDYEQHYENEAAATFAELDYPEREAIEASNRHHHLCLYYEDLANMRRWREKQCSKMLATIADMMQNELHRLINNP